MSHFWVRVLYIVFSCADTLCIKCGAEKYPLGTRRRPRRNKHCIIKLVTTTNTKKVTRRSKSTNNSDILCAADGVTCVLVCHRICIYVYVVLYFAFIIDTVASVFFSTYIYTYTSETGKKIKDVMNTYRHHIKCKDIKYIYM